MFYIQIIIVWVLSAIFAILNGTARAKLYQRHTTKLRAHQISSLTAVMGFLLIYYIFFYLTQVTLSIVNTFIMGSLMFAMTIVFEFIFGHYIMGHN